MPKVLRSLAISTVSSSIPPAAQLLSCSITETQEEIEAVQPPSPRIRPPLASSPVETRLDRPLVPKPRCPNRSLARRGRTAHPRLVPGPRIKGSQPQRQAPGRPDTSRKRAKCRGLQPQATRLPFGTPEQPTKIGAQGKSVNRAMTQREDATSIFLGVGG